MEKNRVLRFIQSSVGGGYSLREILDNLTDEQICELFEDYKFAFGYEKQIKPTGGNELIVSGLNEACKIAHQNAVNKGFYDKERNIGEALMLIVGELGEAQAAHQKGRFANTTEYDIATFEGKDFETNFRENIKDTFEDELADTFIRLMDLSGYLGIDIETFINEKYKYNLTRPRLHGKKY